MSLTPSTSRVPESVAALDMDIVAAALVRHNANVRNAAAALGVPSADLRKLVLLDQHLADAVLEAIEQRLDDCEANLHEALHCDDPRRRDSASMFFLRNVQRAARRGYAVNSAAASLEIKSAEPVTYIVRWGSPDAERETETFERDGQTFEVPKYGNGRDDGIVEGDLSKPAAMIGHTPVLVAPDEGAVERLGADPAGADRVEPTAPADPPLPEWPGPTPPPPQVAHLYTWVPSDPAEINRKRIAQLRRAGY